MHKIGFSWKGNALPVAACAALSLSALIQLRVHADQTSPAKTAAPAGSNATTDSTAKDHTTIDRHATRGQYLARTALAYRGVPYRFGGRSARSGFDCSGLVQSVYAKWGLLLPRAAHAQFKMGVSVKPNDLQPGDLVFFKNTYKHGISHVGIYIGDHYFIHAAGYGKGVCMSRLDQGYHKKHWAGARRLDLSKLPPVPGETSVPEQVILDEDTPTENAPASADNAIAPMPVTSPATR